MKFLPVLALVALAGCAGNPCMHVKMSSYDDGFQKQLTEEIKSAPATAVWPTVVLDYRQLRAAVRTCQGKAPKHAKDTVAEKAAK